jgi:hypothetical protein
METYFNKYKRVFFPQSFFIILNLLFICLYAIKNDHNSFIYQAKKMDLKKFLGMGVSLDIYFY